MEKLNICDSTCKGKNAMLANSRCVWGGGITSIMFISNYCWITN